MCIELEQIKKMIINEQVAHIVRGYLYPFCTFVTVYYFANETVHVHIY